MELLHNRKGQAGAIVALVILIILFVIAFALFLLPALSNDRTSGSIITSTGDSEDLDGSLLRFAVSPNVYCPYTVGSDWDGDGVLDLCDNCMYENNPYQEDRDNDGIGDVCDVEVDRDDHNPTNGSIECSKDSDCGDDRYVGQKFCQQGDVYQQYKEYSCFEDGTEDSYCDSDTRTRLVEECQFGCSDGKCIEGTITCDADSDCGTDGPVGTPFCVGNNVLQNFNDYQCLFPGTQSSQCTTNSSQTTVQQCPYACTSGQCIRCDENLDCNDNNANTNDVCVLPGTVLSYCTNTQTGVCTPGQTRQCGSTDVGECSFGTQTCNAQGQWGSCTGAVGPSNEVCDGKDNDCDGAVDEGGVCAPSCTNECTFGARECSGNGYRTCGYYDSDSCTDWSSVASCSSGQSCSEGYCVTPPPTCTNECAIGARMCSGNGVMTCGNYDADSCTEWSSAVACGAGKECQNGQCVTVQPSCSNECTFGARQCSGNGYKQCGYFDNDACTEWSATTTCSSGQTCSAGYCR